jgi:hypothetical protein
MIPLVGMFCLFTVGILRGSLVPKAEYTATLAIFLMPFSAMIYRTLGIDRFSARGAVGTAVALFCVMFAFSYPRVVPHVLPLSADPIPKFAEQGRVIDLVVPAIRQNLRDEDQGLISDFYGFAATGYGALLTRVHPDRLFLASGAQQHELRLGYPSGEDLSDFIDEYPRGLLLLHNGSRFAEFLGYEASDKLRVGDRLLAVRKIWSTPWPMRWAAHLRASYDVREPEMQLYEYRLADGG